MKSINFDACTQVQVQPRSKRSITRIMDFKKVARWFCFDQNYWSLYWFNYLWIGLLSYAMIFLCSKILWMIMNNSWIVLFFKCLQPLFLASCPQFMYLNYSQLHLSYFFIFLTMFLFVKYIGSLHKGPLCIWKLLKHASTCSFIKLHVIFNPRIQIAPGASCIKYLDPWS
jgi:hypothetical protein